MKPHSARRPVTYLALTAIIMFMPPLHAAQPVSVADDLLFSTDDELLFIDQADPKIISFEAVEETVGPLTEGAIVNVPQNIPVEVLQAAYDTAMNDCTSQNISVNTGSQCANFTYSPTESACRTGSASGTASVSCCVIPVGGSWGNCPNVPFAPDTATFNVSYSVNTGYSLGSRPTQGTSAPFDVGVIASYEAEVKAAVELEIATNDGGFVDIDYDTRVFLQSDADVVPEGEVFTLSAMHVPNETSSMSSEYPAMSAELRFALRVKALFETSSAYLDTTTGQQVYETERHIDIDTGYLDPAYVDENDRLIAELVSIRAGLFNGFNLAILDNVPYAPDGLEGLVWDLPAPPPGTAIGLDLTNPFTCPEFPLQDNNVCGFANPPISTKVFEMSFKVPALETPASPDFNGGVVDLHSVTPVEVLINDLGFDGSLTNTVPSRYRPALNFDPGGDITLDDFIGDQTDLDADYARFKLDLDGLITLPLGPAAGVASPFQKNFDAPLGVLSLEANSLDSDLVLWLSYDQELRFEPNMVVDLAFDKPVNVRPSAADPWVEVTAWTMDVGANSIGLASQLQIRQPPGGVTVTPVYSLRENLFDNTTTPRTTFAWQNTYLQLIAGGLLFDVLAATGNDFDLDFAAIRSILAAEPIDGDPMGGEPHPLTGFSDMAGQPLSIAGAPALDDDDDGVPNLADNCTAVANADQRDSDADGYGNICDADLTGDCLVNFADLVQLKAVFLSSDPHADLDGDGSVNFGDVARLKQSFLGAPGPSGQSSACDGF